MFYLVVKFDLLLIYTVHICYDRSICCSEKNMERYIKDVVLCDGDTKQAFVGLSYLIGAGVSDTDPSLVDE